jgi:hypothetical protein
MSLAALYIYSFLAGIFAANGVPHFVKGIVGEHHQTPFGRPSSAMVNVVFGWANFVIAGIFLHFAHPRAHEFRAASLFMLGVLIMALMLAHAWSHHPNNNKPAQ